MSWYKTAEESEEKNKEFMEMKEWFDKRTKKHIELVRKYCKKISDYDTERFKKLIERGKIHDASKFKNPELDPYLYITWKYKCKDDGVDFEMPEGMEEKMALATEHHVKHNKHHPEFHADKDAELEDRNNRLK